eukprot:6190796-Pleurochrysis_carterae.AAC.2
MTILADRKLVHALVVLARSEPLDVVDEGLKPGALVPHGVQLGDGDDVALHQQSLHHVDQTGDGVHRAHLQVDNKYREGAVKQRKCMAFHHTAKARFDKDVCPH